MKTKEQKIREGWGDYVGINPNIIENILKSEGWMPKKFLPASFDNSLFDIVENYVRPISLRNIEDNNGWTIIKSKDDMPRKDCLVKICINGKHQITTFQWYSKDQLLEAVSEEIPELLRGYKFFKPQITHYKEVMIDKDPLY